MKDRKIISIMILFLLSCGLVLQAQENAGSSGKPISFGIRAGGVFSGFTNHQEIFTSLRSGVNAGVFAEIKPVPFFGVSAEVNYVQEGAFHANPFLIYPASSVNYTTDIYKTSSDIRLHTLQIPLLLNVRAPKISGAVVPKLIVGCSFDFILKATAQNMYMTSGSTSGNPDIPLNNRGKDNVSSSFKSSNIGAVCGFGFDFAGDKVTYMLEARYKIGLKDINGLGGLNTLNSQYDFSVNTFSVTLGIGF
jgi:hypothetical protein